MEQKRKTVCFAYFGDGTFLGWYADTFGSIRKESPKLYGYTPEMVETIRGNFRRKLETGHKAAAELVGKYNPAGEALMKPGLDEDMKILSQYKDVELRAVECPIYDGPNPAFDREKYAKERAAWDAKFEKSEAYLMEIGPQKRQAIEEYKKSNPEPAHDFWVYADYAEVQKWARNEPTEFLEVIK
jgi:hypothetical protein